MKNKKNQYPEDDYRWAPDAKNSYGHFAEYYDQLGWKRYTDSSYTKLKKIIDNLNIQSGQIIDFGCGTGELLLRLSDLGFTGTGIDITPGMIEKARLKLDSSEFELISGDICNIKLNRKFILATCFFDTLNHLTTKRDVLRFVKNVRYHLDEGFFFIFDFLTPEGLTDWDGIEITSKEEYFIIQKGKHHIRKNRAVIDIEGFVKSPDGEYIRFYQQLTERGITVDEMTGHLQKANFKSITMRGFYYDRELDDGGRILGIAG